MHFKSFKVKQNSTATVKHLDYISLEIMFLWQIFPLCDDNGVCIVPLVFVMEYCINLACDVMFFNTVSGWFVYGEPCFILAAS